MTGSKYVLYPLETILWGAQFSKVLFYEPYQKNEVCSIYQKSFTAFEWQTIFPSWEYLQYRLKPTFMWISRPQNTGLLLRRFHVEHSIEWEHHWPALEKISCRTLYRDHRTLTCSWEDFMSNTLSNENIFLVPFWSMTLRSESERNFIQHSPRSSFRTRQNTLILPLSSCNLKEGQSMLVWIMGI